MKNFGGGEDSREERSKYVAEEGLGNGLLGPYTRFFVIPKPSKAEKTAGGKVENKHVTVKPVRLGKWLIKLIAPHQHPVVVADPFCGSGSFLVSAFPASASRSCGRPLLWVGFLLGIGVGTQPRRLSDRDVGNRQRQTEPRDGPGKAASRAGIAGGASMIRWGRQEIWGVAVMKGGEDE